MAHPEVPPDAEQNDLGLEVTPFEWGGGVHEIGSSQFSEYRRVYLILAIFATQPRWTLSLKHRPQRFLTFPFLEYLFRFYLV